MVYNRVYTAAPSDVNKKAQPHRKPVLFYINRAEGATISQVKYDAINDNMHVRLRIGSQGKYN